MNEASEKVQELLSDADDRLCVVVHIEDPTHSRRGRPRAH